MRRNKTLLIILLAFAAVLGGAYALYDRLSGMVETDQLTVEEEAAQETEETEAVQAPDFTVYDGEGNAVQLSDYFGRPIVLNFWASWCGPCQSEMPEFEAAYGELGEEIHFLMVNMTTGRETQESADEFLTSAGYTFPVLYDTEGDAMTTYGAYSLPTTYFIDAEGYAIARAVGALDGEVLQQGIDMIAPAAEES